MNQDEPYARLYLIVFVYVVFAINVWDGLKDATPLGGYQSTCRKGCSCGLYLKDVNVIDKDVRLILTVSGG